MSRFTVNYMPDELSEETMQLIRDTIPPSMEGEDTKQYQCDEILIELGNIQAIVEACEGCDYIELLNEE